MTTTQITAELVQFEVRQLREEMRARFAGLDTLPAPALTEQAIVDALKADPAMAGRVMVALGLSMDGIGRNAMIASAEKSAGLHTDRCAGLSRLAVALAAASYRG